MLWMTGQHSQLAAELYTLLAHNAIPVVATSREQCNLVDGQQVEQFFARHKPSIILHCAAFTQVDKASTHQLDALADNVLATHHLCQIAERHQVRLVFFSTDYLFDGLQTAPYTEQDAPHPLQFYGKTKLLGEQMVSECDNSLTIRLSWLYSTTRGFPLAIVQQAHQEVLAVVDDEVGSPTFIPFVAGPILQLVFSEAAGLYHLACDNTVSRYDLAKQTLELAHYRGLVGHLPQLEAISAAQYQAKHPHSVARPAFSALSSHKAKTTLQIDSLGGWQEHLEAFFASYHG
jgi:dTDP-4-dehydrorhamnose reductase